MSAVAETTVDRSFDQTALHEHVCGVVCPTCKTEPPLLGERSMLELVGQVNTQPAVVENQIIIDLRRQLDEANRKLEENERYWRERVPQNAYPG